MNNLNTNLSILKKIMLIGLTALLFMSPALQSNLYAQFTLETDEEQAIYMAGESMNFLITSSTAGEANYEFRYDVFAPVISSGTISLNANEEVELPFSLVEPGAAFCTVSLNGQSKTAGVCFSPFDIVPYEPDPTDLLSFWEELKDSLSMVSMDPQLTYEEEDDYSTTYRINLANIDNRRVYGYISVPHGSGPFPAVLELPAYGSSVGVVDTDEATAARTGMLAMSISIHNTEPDVQDPNAYEPDEITDEHLIYYRYAILGAFRGLDYLVSRNDYDGENLAVVGVSQGGGLSLLVSSLDDRVKVMAVSNPALCEHTGYKYDKASGFPYYLRKSDNEVGTQAHFDATTEATKYYDAVRYAKYFDGPSLSLIGYVDTICPPASSYAAFNQLPGPKVLVQAREVDHNHPDEYQTGRFDLCRRYFSFNQSPPWPWPDTTIGYYIQAMSDSLQIAVGDSAQLQGLVELNGETNGSWTSSWRKVEGPGNAIFNNAGSLNPLVSFDSAGVYKLEFKAVDEALAIPDKFYTAIDYVNIEVYELPDTMTMDTTITDTMTMTTTLAMEKLNRVVVSPNPSNGSFHFVHEQGEMEGVKVFSVTGRLIFEKYFAKTTDSYMLNLEEWPDGNYYVHVLLRNGRAVEQLVKIE